MKTALFSALSLMVIAIISISSTETKKDFEGTITYDLAYEDVPDVIREQEPLPKTATVKIKGKKMVLILGETPSIISDMEDSTIIMLMDMFGKKLATTRPAAAFIKRYAAGTKISYEKDTKKLAGYTCKKAILDQKGIKMDLYYTEDIQAHHYQYGEVNGFPLAFTEANGIMKTKFVAKAVRAEKIPDSAFDIPDGYELKN